MKFNSIRSGASRVGVLTVLVTATAAALGGLAVAPASAHDAAVHGTAVDKKQFNLTSMCKIDDDTAQLRVRNGSDAEQAFTLTGPTATITDTVAAGTDLLVEVPWTNSANTWKLAIAGYDYTKAIGNNPLCEQPPAYERTQFNLTSMCKIDDDTAQLRVRNGSDAEQPFTLTGPTATITDTVAAGTDLLVEVPWTNSANTWKLAIAGYDYTKAIGNNPLCEAPVEPEGEGDNGTTPEPGDEGSGTTTTPEKDTTPVTNPKPVKPTSTDKADTGTTPATPVAAASADELPHTGAETVGLLAGAAGLLLLGGIALAWSRRETSNA